MRGPPVTRENVVDLGAARAERRDPGTYDGLTCACGSAWWSTAVAVDKNGRITGHALLRCHECGKAPR